MSFAVLLALTATAPALADDPTERQGSARRSGDDSVELIASSRQRQNGGGTDGQGSDRSGRGGGDPAGTRQGTCSYTSPNPFADQITCPQPPPGGQVTRQVVAVPGPDPAVLAQQARDALVLPSPEIHTAPPEVIGATTTAAAAGRRDAVTLFPTWMWVGDGTWGPRSETVSVQGVTVTATATPKQTVWTMGDGTTVVCAGPGTPFRVGEHDPAAESPSGCDHTYTRSSDHQPGDAYQLSATVSWAVTWTVNGAPGGTLDGFSLSDTVPLRVIELQALNQRPDLSG